MIPLNRIGEPNDVAKVIRFLCSEMANYISGQIIQVDGGLAP
ncbi:SDR family oxidoreductase [Clostridium amazonitimonense]|nr:SDR family oxidoreductase [Clostridium amazonitimonense]